MSLPPLVEPAAELTVDEVRRYSRHLIIPDVGMAGQKRLKNAKVLCVGAGGLGSPALMYLAAAGVGTLGVVDFDVVDESNLQRQIIHGQSDVGRLQGASRRATASSRSTRSSRSNLHEERLDSSQRDGDLRASTTWSSTARTTSRRATWSTTPACCSASRTSGARSTASTARPACSGPEHGPCYRCLYPEPPPPGMVPSCAEGGVLGVLCASIGSIQVTEAIKLLTGIGDAAGGPADGLRRPGDAVPRRSRSARTRTARCAGRTRRSPS